jgi:hypothetical protein
MPCSATSSVFVVQSSPKKKLDKRNALCIIDSNREGGLDHANEKDEFLFSGFADQKAKGNSKENWPSPFRYFKASD